ncbi:hypothetical protein RND71_005637 [Anisodus tanguticus]|uniref:Uncharacterized protein n=1 Tax=Anisodus tanguticus TaxID=243964 RepID=A0AAE1SSF0_9SOLA|nr:hypothetical protein RND71_005637 [Anisodus tanguticus]
MLRLETPKNVSWKDTPKVDDLANEYLLEEDSDLDFDLKNFKSIDPSGDNHNTTLWKRLEGTITIQLYGKDLKGQSQ